MHHLTNTSQTAIDEKIVVEIIRRCAANGDGHLLVGNCSLGFKCSVYLMYWIHHTLHTALQHNRNIHFPGLVDSGGTYEHNLVIILVYPIIILYYTVLYTPPSVHNAIFSLVDVYEVFVRWCIRKGNSVIHINELPTFLLVV